MEIPKVKKKMAFYILKNTKSHFDKRD